MSEPMTYTEVYNTTTWIYRIDPEDRVVHFFPWGQMQIAMPYQTLRIKYLKVGHRVYEMMCRVLQRKENTEYFLFTFWQAVSVARDELLDMGLLKDE